MKYHRKHIFLFIVVILFIASGCHPPNIGGAGWDEKRDVEEAKKYPTVVSDRVSVTSEEVPYQTFKQEFDGVFQDFPNSGNPISTPFKITNTQINGTPYSVSYENYVLKVFREGEMIAERKLPRVFYMHPLTSGAIIEKSRFEDVVICNTYSRATTGLHYVLIINGNGEILFEKIMKAGEDWDILPSEEGDIVIGGAHTKTTIKYQK